MYTISHKIKQTYFNVNKSEKQTNIPGISGHENSIVVNTAVQNGYCVKYNILGDND